MKKIIFILFSIIGYSAIAQDVKFGVFIEPQITWLTPEARNISTDGTTLGLNGGLSVDKYFQKNYAISTGLSTGWQGGKLKFDDQITMEVYDSVTTLPANSVVKYRLNYITVPLGLKLRSNEIGFITFFASIGFTNQINIKAIASSDLGANALDKDAIKSEIGLFNMGYHIGGGVDYSLGKDTSISLGIIYNDGFIDITTSSPRVTSRMISLRAGIIF